MPEAKKLLSESPPSKLEPQFTQFEKKNQQKFDTYPKKFEEINQN